MRFRQVVRQAELAVLRTGVGQVWQIIVVAYFKEYNGQTLLNPDANLAVPQCKFKRRVECHAPCDSSGAHRTPLGCNKPLRVSTHQSKHARADQAVKAPALSATHLPNFCSFAESIPRRSKLTVAEPVLDARTKRPPRRGRRAERTQRRRPGATVRASDDNRATPARS